MPPVLPNGQFKITILHVTDELRALIEEYVVVGLNKYDSHLPTALCSTRYNMLNAYSNEDFTRNIHLYDHSKVNGPTVITRDHAFIVCDIGSALFGQSLLRPGRPSTTSNPSHPGVFILFFCFIAWKETCMHHNYKGKQYFGSP